MNTKKLSKPFVLAVGFHLFIAVLFGLSYISEPELVKQKPLPEIIQAAMVDDEIILEEAERLKNKEKSKQVAQQKNQQALENKRKQEQELLKNAKNQRLQEEQKAKELQQKRQQNELIDKQKQEKIKKQKAEEANRLAKIEKQKEVEKQRLDDLRKAAEKKKKLERLAAQIREKEQLAKKQAAETRKSTQLKKLAADAKARKQQGRQATITATAAIQRKVNQRWIKPISSPKGLSCTIRVKLLPSGDVMDANVVSSSGNDIFDRSAENAVRKASPLPVPKDRRLFTSHFRTFTFEFKPE